MTSNLQVLGQFVASLNCMSSEVMMLAFGTEVFPSDAVDAPGPLPISSCNNCMKCSEYFPGLSK